MKSAVTRGIHHIGLTVDDLEASVAFFTELLGWEIAGGNEEYPAVFVKDGEVMVTLWRAVEPEQCNPFDKNNSIGLHHLALGVGDVAALESLHQQLVNVGVQMEFGPEPLRGGPAVHMMCHGPGGIRIEFIVAP